MLRLVGIVCRYMMLKGTDILHITQNIILNRVGSLPHWACSLLDKKRKESRKGNSFFLFNFIYQLHYWLMHLND